MDEHELTKAYQKVIFYMSLIMILDAGDGYHQQMKGTHEGCGGLEYSHILKK
ncbi:MAG: hypothetical protein JKY51_06845 [Opitutaceae bacterium]|nr:hypothetical protein [Opitutaceae bacterium]